jgi:hypothetical protein
MGGCCVYEAQGLLDVNKASRNAKKEVTKMDGRKTTKK